MTDAPEAERGRSTIVRRSGALAAVLLATLTGSAANAQPADDGFFDLAVPGGRSTLALADVPNELPRAGVLPHLVRLLYTDPAGSAPLQDQRLARLRARLERLDRLQAGLQAALAGLDRGELTLKAAEAPQARVRLLAALAALGLRFRDPARSDAVGLEEGPDAEARRNALSEAGLDVPRLMEELNAGATVRPALATLTLPLPLSPTTWHEVVLDRSAPSKSLASAILLDRRAALLLNGLSAMDAPTRAYLAAHPDLLRTLADRSATVCAFGRSLRIADEAVVLPGGPDAGPSWGALADVHVRHTEEFVTELFGRDQGRLAYYYDTVAHLTPPQQIAVLGLDPTARASQAEHARSAYDAFLATTDGWRHAERPFLRPVFDAAIVLDALAVRDDGTLAGPVRRRFWLRAFDSGLPSDPVRDIRPSEPDADTPVVALLQQLVGSDHGGRRRRFEQYRFVQRLAPAPEASALPDLLVAVRAYARYPALMAALERLGIADPATFARAARHAARLDGMRDPARRYVALAEFQGAVSLIDGLVASRYLGADEASRLTESLVALPLAAGGYDGVMAGWIDGTFLPSLSPDATREREPSEVESLLLDAWSGPAGLDPSPAFRWEGHDYDVDPRAAERARLRSLRARQRGADLGATLALARAVARLADASDVAAARRALDEVQRTVEGVPPVANPSLPPGPTLADRVGRVDAALARARGPTDLPKVLRAAAPLTGQAEQVLAQSLLSLAYTRHLGDPDTVVLTDDGLAQRHDFGVAADVTAGWVRPADSIESSERRLVGSLMGIDLTLAKLALRRLSETVPAAPSMNTVVLQEVRETVTLAARQPPTDDQLATVARGIETGRERVAAAAVAAPSAVMELAARAGMSEARRSVIPWMLREEPDRVPGLFGLAELYWAGGGGALPPVFGTSASEIDGCWCLQVPRPRPWEDVAGRPGMPLVAARVVDLGLAMVVHMHALGIPARVYPAVLAFAAGEYVEAAALRYAEDWHALTHAAAAIPRERVEDYVSGLTGDGPLRRREQATR